MKRLTNRLKAGILIGAIGLVSAIGAYAQGCGGSNRTVLDVLEPVIQNKQVIKTDPDGKVYVRFDSGLKGINDISLHPDKYHLTSSDGLEPVFNTLEGAMKHLEPSNKYVAEIDVKKDLHYGQITKVFARNGKQVPGHAFYRCLDSPLIFGDQ